jgi:uncharacterized protein (TIGR03435 family)
MNGLRAILGGLAMSAAAWAQGAAPGFEVASVKSAAPQQQGMVMTRMGGDAGRVDFANVNLTSVLARAYNLKANQIVGPSWLDSERYDIVAKVPEGVNKDQIPAMLQTLLAERFKLTVHKETKETQVYGLTVAKSGAKLEKAEPTPAADPAATPARSGSFSASASASGPGASLPAALGGSHLSSLPRGATGITVNSGTGKAKVQSMATTLSRFADTLANLVGKPVLNETGIEGEYNITLELGMEDLAGVRMTTAGAAAGAHQTSEMPMADREPAPSLFTAIQSLGLRLDPRKAPVEYLVIDKGDKVPTEN